MKRSGLARLGVVVLVVLGSAAGVLVAQGSAASTAPATPIEATAQQVSCSQLPALTAEEAASAKSCFDESFASAPPAGATHEQIELAKEQAICDLFAQNQQTQPEWCATIKPVVAAEGVK